MLRLFFLLILSISLLPAGDLQWDLAAESGMYQQESSFPSLMGRLNGQFNYSHALPSISLKLQGGLTPEWLGNQSGLSSLRFSGKMLSERKYKSGLWNIYFLLNDYYFHPAEQNYAFFQTNTFGLSTLHSVDPGKTLYSTIEYAFREMDSKPSNKMGLWRAHGGLGLLLPLKARLRFSLNLEHFVIQSANEADKHRGWRMGPGMGFQFRGRFILRFNYRLDKAFSEQFGSEQNMIFMRFLWGSFLRPGLAAFLYLDYQKTENRNKKIPLILRYAPLEEENRIYLKLEYDLNKQSVLYGKGGYFRDTLPDGNNIYSGFQFLVGLRFKH